MFEFINNAYLQGGIVGFSSGLVAGKLITTKPATPSISTIDPLQIFQQIIVISSGVAIGSYIIIRTVKLSFD